MNVYTFDTRVERLRDGKRYQEAKELRVELPAAPEEITLRAWVDFAEVQAAAPSMFTDAAVGALEGATPSRAVPQDAWQSFIAYALKAVWTLAANRDEFTVTDLTRLPIAAGVEAEAADGLLALFATVLQPIKDYVPKRRESFQHDGHTYALYTDYLDQFGTNWVGKDLRTAEAVDALQFEQVFYTKNEDGTLAIKDGPYKNALALVAILSRKVLPDGTLELPPIPMVERNQWLDDRMVELAGVSMDVALDVGFFLPDSKTQLRSTLLSVLRGKMRPHLRA